MLRLQPVACLEDPGDDAKAQHEEQQCHAEADADIDVRQAEKAPAETADQIDDGIDQCDACARTAAACRSNRRCRRGKSAASRSAAARLQLLETVGPDADDEAEQAEGRPRSESERPASRSGCTMCRSARTGAAVASMIRPRTIDLRRRRADIADDDFKRRDRRRQDFIDRADEAREINAERGVG